MTKKKSATFSGKPKGAPEKKRDAVFESAEPQKALPPAADAEPVGDAPDPEPDPEPTKAEPDLGELLAALVIEREQEEKDQKEAKSAMKERLDHLDLRIKKLSEEIDNRAHGRGQATLFDADVVND
jgi:hypothetical protein